METWDVLALVRSSLSSKHAVLGNYIFKTQFQKGRGNYKKGINTYLLALNSHDANILSGGIKTGGDGEDWLSRLIARLSRI